MFNGAANNNNNNNNKNKRKMNEVEWTLANQQDFLNPNSGRQQLHYDPSSPTPSFFYDVNRFYASSSHQPPQMQQQPPQQVPTPAPAVRPFSFTSLLTAESEEDEDEETLAAQITSNREQVKNLFSFHNNMLIKTLDEMVERQCRSIQRAADERASKKLEHLDNEVQKKSDHIHGLEAGFNYYRRAAEALSEANKVLTNTNKELSETNEELRVEKRILKRRLEQVRAARLHGEEEGDSCTEDYVFDRAVEPTVNLNCKGCNKQMANMMMWPCRHVCLCKQCEAKTKRCPECRVAKSSSVEFSLSPKQD